MSPDCGLKTQIVLHSSGTKPRLKLQQWVNLVGTLGRSQRNPTQSYQISAVSVQPLGGGVLVRVSPKQ